MDRVKVKTRSAIEDDLRILHRMYSSKGEHEKQLLWNWIGDIARMGERGLSLAPKPILIVEFVEPNAEGEVIAVTISATAAKLAFECWDRGQQYSPSIIEFCGEEPLYEQKLTE
jgi:hypothetical protein